ncbi:MAG: chromate transporter [Chloroflexota bacterium]|nr:chromate transporter [Chloroflexota bacterium]
MSTPPRRLRDLFLGFLLISIMGFGGVLPFARRAIVEQRAWLPAEEFTDVFALGVFLPGGSLGNVAAILGHRFFGWRGAVVGYLGLYTPPVFVTLGFTWLYSQYGQLPVIRGAVQGVAAVAAGLLLSTAAKFLVPYVRAARLPEFGFIVVSFVLVGLVRVPLLGALGVVAPLSIATAWWRRGT